MNKRQTTIVSIFVLFAALLALCGCKDNEKKSSILHEATLKTN